MTTLTVLLTAPLSEDALETLTQADALTLTTVDPAALGDAIVDADAVIIDEDVTIDAALLDRAPKLKLIGRASTSLANIDLDEATRRGIIVMNTPGVDAVTVAEYTFALMLALVRDVVGAHRAVGTDHEVRLGTQLQGRTLGIIGLGRVGREVAARALAFGMEVLAADPYVSESAVSDLRLKLVGLQEVLSEADIITLHTPLIPNTTNLIDVQALKLMRPGAFLINVKDGQLMDEAAVRAVLDRGQLAGVAVDMFATDEPADSPLYHHPQVIHSQRNRGNTGEAQRDLSVLIAQQVIDALRGQDYRNAVNLPFMPGQEYERIAPQLGLAERIGRLLHALGRHAPIQRVSIDVSGAELSDLIKPLMVGILRGLLAPALGEDAVNFINAPVLAAERGINVTQTKALNIKTYPNLVSCEVLWDDGFALVVAGALFNETEPRIVQVDRYRTDFVPEGVLLIMGSYDVPGVIGRVGTFMADHQINIAGWRTSRAEKGGHTLSIISIDEPMSEALLNRLREQDFVRHLTQMSFEAT